MRQIWRRLFHHIKAARHKPHNTGHLDKMGCEPTRLCSIQKHACHAIENEDAISYRATHLNATQVLRVTAKPTSLDGGYVVQLKKSGQEFSIPQGKTILQVLREAGVSAPYSCEEGVCAACQVNVLSGIPDHRDSVLSAGERESGKTMLICCSGSKSARIVIDF